MSEPFAYLSLPDRLQAVELARHIARKDWALFVGSGVSRPSGLPLWGELVDMMAQRLGLEADSFDPLEIASLFEVTLGRNELVVFLRESLQTLGFSPTTLHARLLDLHPPVIVTTNFDDLLERALDPRRIPHTIVITNGDLALAGTELQIIKPHGDLKYPDSLVISEQDYERYPTQERVNEKLCSLAAQQSFFFIGYSLSDPDLKQQLRKVLDSQQKLARHHYLVISKIDHLRREAFSHRNIKVIELGSYDRLEQFLVDLCDESVRQGPPDTLTHPISISGSSDALALEHDDQALLIYLDIDYSPVIESLQRLRLTDAEDNLRGILEKVRKAADIEPSITHMPRLKDFHQRILLALATIAVRRKRYQEARGLYQKSEAIQPFEGKRRLQAAEVLIGLGEFRQVDALLAERVEADEGRGKQLLGLTALLQDDEARFRSLYPEGEAGNLEFAIQHARLAVESSSHTDIEKALDLLQKAWSLTQDFPLGRLVVAEVTDRMLRRILFEEWEAPGVDRLKLLRTIRERYQDVLSTFEALADQYPEGLATTLVQLITFHGFLGEEEVQHDLLNRLQALSGMTRDRILAEHAVERATPELEVIETLFLQQQLSVGEKALLKGTALMREGKALEAEQVYRQALEACTESIEHSVLIESLLSLMLEDERYEEAVAFLEQAIDVGTVFQELMRAMLFAHQKDCERALSILRRTLSQHPRNMLLLINLIRLLRRQPEVQVATTPPFMSEDEHTQNFTEALCYAERLEALLPSFGHKRLRAELLERLGRYDDAIQLVEEIECEGYHALRTMQLKFSLLQKLGRYREAAEFLAENEARYPDNYALRFNQATAWAKAGEIERAIALWEALRHCPEVNSDLYQNLINAQMQLEALNPDAVGHAFDIVKEALEKFPDRKEFAGFLIQTGEGSGRGREAWEIIKQRPDLREGPSLRAIPADEAINFIVREKQALQSLEDAYRAGALPFAAYAECSPRPTTFLWQARLHLWRQGNRTRPLLCGFPPAIFESPLAEIPDTGIVLDRTALLTLGSLKVTREVLEALQRADKPVFLPPHTRNWLEDEVARLSLDQLPAYRERRKRLQDKLLAARGKVELVTELEGQKDALDESVRGQLGLSAWDVEIALDHGYLYVDDYLPPEIRKELPQTTMITSASLMASLEATGSLFPDEVERIRTAHPSPFATSTGSVLVTLDRPVMFSLPALMIWFETGLLDSWLQSSSGWPPKIVVGPTAWYRLSGEVTEDEIYREALQLARDLQASLAEALEHDHVEELPVIQPPDIGVTPNLREPLASTLSLFAQARAQKCAVWSDDLCTRMLVNSRGMLTQEHEVVDAATRARQAFPEVSVMGTSGVFQWLESTGQLSRERHLTLLWQLHQAGYRFLDISEVLLSLLQRFQYNCKAVPVAELLRDLESASSFTLPHVDPERLRLFVDIYTSGVLSRAVGHLWRLTDPALASERRKELSTELIRRFETTTNWTITQRLFWDSLINRLWLGDIEGFKQESIPLAANLQGFMTWLVEYVLADLDRRRSILSEIEDYVLNTLRYLRHDLEDGKREAEAFAKALIAGMLVPFFSGGLLDEFDPVFQRLIGYVVELDMQFTQSVAIKTATGESFDLVVMQEEMERQACDVLGQVIEGLQAERLGYLYPFHIGFLLEKSVDPSTTGSSGNEPLKVSIHQEVPLLFLPIVAAPSLRKALFAHFHALFEEVEPSLAWLIDKLRLDLIGENPVIAQKALKRFYLAYLLSTHFQFTRNAIRGFDYLTNLASDKLDSLCGALPIWPQEATYKEMIEELMRQEEESGKGISQPQKPSTWFLLLEPSRLAFSFTGSPDTFDQRLDIQNPDILSYLVELTETDVDLFRSLGIGLALLLRAAYCFPDLKIPAEEDDEPLREWLARHLLQVLRYKPQGIVGKKKAGPGQDNRQLNKASRDNQFLRRSIHAKLLRCIFRAVVSPTRVKALNEAGDQEPIRNVAGELLMKGVILASRILPILLQHTRLPLEQLDQQLAEFINRPHAPRTSLYLRDQFNPERYGPDQDQYEHFLTGTLAVFREMGFDESGGGKATITRSFEPFWLTREVRRDLMALAKRPENEAERWIREARERGVPNRLQTYLDRTPQEYAADILQLASPDRTKEEMLLLEGQTRLLELLRQVSDTVNVDIQPLTHGSDRPDMVARVNVGGQERHILVEAKTSAEPRFLRQAIAQLQHHMESLRAPYGIILAPSISPRGAKLCEEQGVGYVDLQGNAFIKFSGIFIKTSAVKKPARRAGRARSLFAPVSSRLVRALLSEPERRWKLQELAKVTRMSLGQAHKVKQRLLDQEFIASDRNRQLFLQDPAGLLDAWQKTYRYEQNDILQLFSLEKPPEIEKNIKQYCESKKIRYALTLFSGVSKLAPFVRYNVVSFYMVGDKEELLQDLRLKPVDSGANVLILSPYDEGVFYGLRESQGYNVVNSIQLYVDLYNYGGRGREQAAFLRQKLIGF